LPTINENSYYREILEKGVPSKQELLKETKNFFEDPISLDVITFSCMFNMIQKLIEN
jgi:hypothetical protein